MEKDKERRLLRVGQSIQNEISLMLLKDVKDPALMDVTITGVKMAVDLSTAKVFFSLLQVQNKERILRSLRRAAPFFQGKLGQILQIRHTPRLTFIFDETPQKSARINEIVHETKIDRQNEALNSSPEKELAKHVASAEFILLGCHKKPDGDALGSALAMQRILQLCGKKSVVFVPEKIADNLMFLPGVGDVVHEIDSDTRPSLTILLDTASVGQMPIQLQDMYNAQALGHVAVIDHHAHSEKFGHTIIRREISATGQLLFDLIQELVWPMDDRIAICLYAAIVADTGSFRYSNTTKATFLTAAELMSYKFSPSEVAKELFDTFSLARQRVFGVVASTLEIEKNGSYATLFCSKKMLDQTSASAADLEGFVNIGRNVKGVKVSVLFTEIDDGIKASLRANGNIDVASVAVQFGGGGHRAAAGVTFEGIGMEEAIRKLANAFDSVL